MQACVYFFTGKGQDTAVLVSKTSYFSNSDRNASKAQDDMTQRKHKITFSEETEEIVNEQRSKTNLSQAETSTPSVNASSASLQNNTQKEGTGKNETNTGKEEAEKAVNASSSSLQKNTQGEGTGKNDTNTKKEEDEQEEEEERAKAEDKGELEQEPISVESTGTDTEDESDEATNDINAEKEDAEKVEEEEQEEEEEEEERVDVEYKGELEPEPISVESTGTETEDESDETTNEINIDIEKEKKELEPFITAMKSGIEENISKKKLKPKLIVSQSQSKPRNEKKVKGNKHLPNKWEAGNDEGSSEIETRTGDGNETQLESKVERSQVLNEASVLEGAVATMEKLGKGSVTETSKGTFLTLFVFSSLNNPISFQMITAVTTYTRHIFLAPVILSFSFLLSSCVCLNDIMPVHAVCLGLFQRMYLFLCMYVSVCLPQSLSLPLSDSVSLYHSASLSVCPPPPHLSLSLSHVTEVKEA